MRHLVHFNNRRHAHVEYTQRSFKSDAVAAVTSQCSQPASRDRSPYISFSSREPRVCTCRAAVATWASHVPHRVVYLHITVISDKCTKHQFIHLLTATFKNLHIENTKNYKRWYCPHHTDCVSMCCWIKQTKTKKTKTKKTPKDTQKPLPQRHHGFNVFSVLCANCR